MLSTKTPICSCGTCYALLPMASCGDCYFRTMPTNRQCKVRETVAILTAQAQRRGQATGRIYGDGAIHTR